MKRFQLVVSFWTRICALNFLLAICPCRSNSTTSFPPSSQFSKFTTGMSRKPGGGYGNKATDNCGVPSYKELMLDFEDAVLKQQSSFVHGSRLIELEERFLQSQIQHRLTELEGSGAIHKLK